MTLLFPDLTDETQTGKPRKPQRPVEPPKPDPLAEALVAKGLVPSAYHLDINRGLQVKYGMELPHPWNLPSRLFQFPIEVTDQAKDGTRKIGLLHPLLADHPYVRHVDATLGIQIEPDGVQNEYGHSKCRTGSWWHAVDLMTTGHWHDLLATAQFTTPGDIAGAVSHGLSYSPHEGTRRDGYISTAEAREIMAVIDAPEPTDRDALIREHFLPPSPTKQDKGADHWPINTRPGDINLNAWGHIIGIECGWFAHDRAGFLGWTERGRKRFPTEKREQMTALKPTREQSGAQIDETRPSAERKINNQLDLF